MESLLYAVGILANLQSIDLNLEESVFNNDDVSALAELLRKANLARIVLNLAENHKIKFEGLNSIIKSIIFQESLTCLELNLNNSSTTLDDVKLLVEGLSKINNLSRVSLSIAKL